MQMLYLLMMLPLNPNTSVMYCPVGHISVQLWRNELSAVEPNTLLLMGPDGAASRKEEGGGDVWVRRLNKEMDPPTTLCLPAVLPQPYV